MAALKEKVVPLKGGGFEWTIPAKDNWHGVVGEGKLPPRIRRLDDKTFACYREGKYLGSEISLKAAFDRIQANHVSDKNVALAIWQKHHPDELPPFLQLTEAERAEYWRHNPPKGGTIKAEPKPKPRVLDGEMLPRTGEVKVAGKVVGHSATVTVSPPSPRKRSEGGDKNTEVRALLTRKSGCTVEELLRVTGWKAISVPQVSARLGLALRIDKGVKPFKYYGEEK